MGPLELLVPSPSQLTMEEEEEEEEEGGCCIAHWNYIYQS